MTSYDNLLYEVNCRHQVYYFYDKDNIKHYIKVADDKTKIEIPELKYWKQLPIF